MLSQTLSKFLSSKMDLVQGENSHLPLHECGASSSSVCQSTRIELPVDAVPLAKDNRGFSLGKRSSNMDLVRGENSHVLHYESGESSSSVCQSTQTDLHMDAVPLANCSLGKKRFSKFLNLKMDLVQGKNSHVSLHECAEPSYVRPSNQQSSESQNVEEQQHEEVDSNAYGKPASVMKCLCLAIPCQKSREQLHQKVQYLAILNLHYLRRSLLSKEHTTTIQVPSDPATSEEVVQAMCQTSSLDHRDLLMQNKASHAPFDPVALRFESIVAEESISTAVNPDVFWRNAEEEFEKLPEVSKQLTLYCSLFPADYEFEKDTFIGLLMAEDFIGNMIFESLEKAGDCFFRYLLGMKFILPSRKRRGELSYKVNQALTPLFKKAYLSGDYLAVKDWNMVHIPERLQHLSIVCEESNEGNFELLERCSYLQTLLLLAPSGSRIHELPNSLFLFLKSLRCLDLSRSNISILPFFIGQVTTLRYINLSETFIRRLPESLCELCNLQTLILNDCPNLSNLPSGLRKLTSLRHFIFDGFRRFIGMPVGIGSLTNLRTFSAFIVGDYNHCSILELKHLNYLSGKFCILGLENITNPAEAQIDLSKKSIEILELWWGEKIDQSGVEEEEVLGHLQPHSLLKDFKVVNYGGLKFPDWVGNSSYVGLHNITLSRCKNCLFLPSLGRLPSLKFLCLYGMDSVMEINRQFCGTSQSSYAFPKLEELKILTMSSLRKWTGVENGDFPYLKEIVIECCPELVMVPAISYLKSLKYMRVSFCPKLSFLPSQGVSPSLKVLSICDCSILKENWKKREGENWPNISQDLYLYVR